MAQSHVASIHPSAGTDASALTSLVHGWAVAGPDEQLLALQQLLHAVGSTGERLQQLPPLVMQQVITLLLQASLSSAAQPSSAATQAHAQKLQLERLWRLLASGSALAQDQQSLQLLDAVIAAHTPTQPGGDKSASQSRRNSLHGMMAAPATSAAAAGSPMPLIPRSRRGSLSAQPVEEEAVASMRHHAFRLAFEFMAAHTAQPSPALLATPESSQAACDLYMRGVCDMWSAIRKTSASSLARSPVVSHLDEHQLQALFEELLRRALGETSPSFWQVQEGAVMALSALLTALQRKQTQQKATGHGIAPAPVSYTHLTLPTT